MREAKGGNLRSERGEELGWERTGGRTIVEGRVGCSQAVEEREAGGRACEKVGEVLEESFELYLGETQNKT